MTDVEVLCLPVRRPAAGFGVFLQTSKVAVVEAIEPGEAAEQGEITTSMNAVPPTFHTLIFAPAPNGLSIQGTGGLDKMRAVFVQVGSRWAMWCLSSPECK